MAEADVDSWLPQYFASLVQDAREDWIALGKFHKSARFTSVGVGTHPPPLLDR